MEDQNGRYLELVDLSLQPSNLVVTLLQTPLQVERLVLQGVDARLPLLQLHLQLWHQRAQVRVVVGTVLSITRLSTKKNRLKSMNLYLHTLEYIGIDELRPRMITVGRSSATGDDFKMTDKLSSNK